MKKLRYTSYAAVVLLLAAIASCNKMLDEYNPSGANPDDAWSTPQGFVTAVNSAYYEQRAWYGKDDGLFMGETGVDLWYNAGGGTYSNQLSGYISFTPATGNFNKSTWKALWRGIDQCNEGITRIDKAGFTDTVEYGKRLGELKFLRAFYYWHVVESWGGVMLRTTPTTEPIYTADRSTVAQFYDLIISDLLYAKDHLPLTWGTAEYSRASKKSAMGFLARAYLSRAYYATNTAEAADWFTKARDAANAVITQKATLGCDLYSTIYDLWLPSNNKRNKEALYIISNSATNTGANYDKNGNTDHQAFMARYSDKPGLQQDTAYGYGADNAQKLMPTRYLLGLFDETIDARYDGCFQEVWYSNKAYKWGTKDTTTYHKPFMLNRTTVLKDTALYFTKRDINTLDTTRYIVVDRDSIYNTDGTYNPNWANTFPGLKKFSDPNRTTATATGYNDVLVMRLAEMYLISAEAEFMLGNNQAAADKINVLRSRAAKPGQTAAMQVSAGMITKYFILEERARELCGEHIRWFDLKRMLNGNKGEEFANWIKLKNPNITSVMPYHRLRPVPQDELQALLNAKQFGQNDGYDQP